MKHHIAVVAMTAFFAAVYVTPTFAHCHESRYECQTPETVCESSCEDGFSCGVDGHYCNEHREGETCNVYTEYQPARRQGHHHGRH